MSKFIFKGNRFRRSWRLFDKGVTPFRRNYTDDKNKDETPQAVRKGVLHDKQQSIQEESFFHKEEVEKLKELKKKVKSVKDKSDENVKKD